MSAGRVLTAAATLAAALVLAGCVTSGTVTGKSYDGGDVCVPREEWERASVGEFYDGPTVRR